MTWETVQLRLLEVGEKIFREQGFNGTGVQQITDAADVPKGSFYNHFPSKEAFAVEVLNHHWASNPAQTRLSALVAELGEESRADSNAPAYAHSYAHASADSRADARTESSANAYADSHSTPSAALPLSAHSDTGARIKAYFSAMAEDCLADDFHSGSLLGNMAAEMSGQNEAIRITVEAIFTHWTDCLSQAIKLGQRKGELPDRIPSEVLAATLLDAWHGAVMRSKLDRNPLPFDRFFTLVFDLLLHSADSGSLR